MVANSDSKSKTLLERRISEESFGQLSGGSPKMNLSTYMDDDPMNSEIGPVGGNSRLISRIEPDAVRLVEPVLPVVCEVRKRESQVPEEIKEFFVQSDRLQWTEEAKNPKQSASNTKSNKQRNVNFNLFSFWMT